MVVALHGARTCTDTVPFSRIAAGSSRMVAPAADTTSESVGAAVPPTAVNVCCPADTGTHDDPRLYFTPVQTKRQQWHQMSEVHVVII